MPQMFAGRDVAADGAALDAIGGGGVAGIAVVAAGASEATIQAALDASANTIVYLEPGTYTFTSFPNFVLPEGKSLIGLGTSVAPTTTQAQLASLGGDFVRFNITGSYVTGNGIFEIEHRGTIRNIIIDMSGVTTVGSPVGSQAILNIQQDTPNAWQWAEVSGVHIHGHPSSAGTMGYGIHMRAGVIEDCGLHGHGTATTGYGIFTASGGFPRGVTIRKCFIQLYSFGSYNIGRLGSLYDCYSGASTAGVGYTLASGDFNKPVRAYNCIEDGSLVGFSINSYCSVIHCKALNNTQDGILMSQPNMFFVDVSDCRITPNGGDGIDFSGATPLKCYIRNNVLESINSGKFGIRTQTTSGSKTLCQASNNIIHYLSGATPLSLGTGWSNVNNISAI